MRISDWSSDVCSSDLLADPDGELHIFLLSVPVDACAECARHPRLPRLIVIAIARSALRSQARRHRKRLIEHHAFGIEGDHRVGKHAEVDPGTFMAVRQVRHVRHGLLIVPHAPGPPRPRIERPEGAIGAAGEYLVEVAVAVEVLQRSEEHTSELQSLMRISYAVLCLHTQNNT